MADDEEGSELRYAAERCDLLLKIKSTVDGLLASGSHVTWSTYGGLGRISDNLEQILMHGCRVIVGKNGTKLGITELFNCLKDISQVNPDQHDQYKEDSDDINQWIQRSLLRHTLSVALAKFVKSTTRLKHYYYKFGFLRSLPHFQALQQCLRAIEEDDPLLLTTIDYILLNKQKYVEEYRKKLGEWGTLYRGESSSEYTSANEEPIDLNGLSDNSTEATQQKNSEKDLGITNDSNEVDFFSIKQDDEDDFFKPKISGSTRTKKVKPLFDETILATAAFTAAMEPVDVQNEIRWFEGDLIEPAAYGTLKSSKKTKIMNTEVGTKTMARRKSNESLSSTSTIDSLPFDDQGGGNKNNKENLSEHEKKKKFGHYRSKSDQFRRFRPFGSSKQILRGTGDNSKGDCDLLSSSLPTNSDVAEFYGGTSESPAPPRKDHTPILGFLSSREYDTCHEFDKENAHFSISEALIGAIEQMKYETFHDSDQEECDDDDGSDEEILQLRAQIKEKKMAKKQCTQRKRLLSDANTRSSSTTTKSTETSVSSGSSHSSYFREIARSVDSDYNSSADLPSPEFNKTVKAVEESTRLNSGSSLDTSSMEISSSPISAEQVALSLLHKVASRKNLKSSDLQWMVSEQDVPQSLLPLPTAVPVSPDDELYDTSEHFSRKTSLPSRLRGNLEWAPPRQQIIFSIPPNPKRKEVMAKQGFRCAGCGMRVDPGYMKRFRYCNYLGKYFCNTCHSTKPTVIPARIIQRWDFKEYDVSNFARDLLNRVHNDPLFNIKAINKSLYKRVKELGEIKHLRLQLHRLVLYLRTCRYGEKLLEHINTLPSHILEDEHLYSINDFLEVKSGTCRERLRKMVSQALEHVSSCQLCLAKGFICEYCRNDDDIIYPFEVKRCCRCPDCSACYHRECFVEGKCPKCERILLRKKAAEVFNIEEDEDL